MQINNETRLYSASDICNFLECQHLTATDLINLVTPLNKAADSEDNQLIQNKGLEHEAAYLESLKKSNAVIADLSGNNHKSLAEKIDATRKAMESGADILFQATLQDGCYVGHADFLRKVPYPSDLGDYSYEVIDTKLAKTAKAKFLVQMALYSRLLKVSQGVAPHYMHVVLGDPAKTEKTYRVADYADYLESVLKRFEAFVALQEHPETYPDPCEHCKFCSWRNICDDRRAADDHLSAVANISKSQIRKLQTGGIHRLQQLAEAGENCRPQGLNAESFAKVQRQARLQQEGRTQGTQVYELLEQQEGRRGFSRLPRPVMGDLFFDMEGNPMEEGGLEYLFGLYIDEPEGQRFLPFWGHSRSEEKQAFEAFIDFVMAHLQRYPAAYIYHYATYEETAIKRLMTQHGTREAQVDSLLRNGKLIDLYKVVREGVVVSEPSYSIKYIEHFYMPSRTGDVTNAGASIVFYEQWKQTGDPSLLEKIERYNEDDVRSTYLLRNWLLEIKPKETSFYTLSNLPEEAVTAQGPTELEQRLESYRNKLLADLPADEKLWDEHARANALVFQLLDFHRRADKPIWWDMFRRQGLDSGELLEDIDCLADLRRTALKPIQYKRSYLYQYSFPVQDTKMRNGSNGKVIETLTDVNLHELNLDDCLATFKATEARKPPEYFDMGPGGPIDSKIIRTALFRYADSIIDQAAGFSAIADFLLRRRPRVKGIADGAPLIPRGLESVETIMDVVRNLDDSVLFIQGPPGAGKTYTASHVILGLLRAGKKVGVSSNSHHAINNLLAAVETRADEAKFSFRGLKKSGQDDESAVLAGPCIQLESDKNKLLDKWQAGASLIAGTAWLFSEPGLTSQLDYLFLDEAGQVSLANLVAMGMSARNLVLMGDQMQLAQPVQGQHPGHSGDSTLDYLLNGLATIPADRGIFLSQTWRMHPAVCSFISEAVYDSQLTSATGTENQRLSLDGKKPGIPEAGLYFHPVEHTGNGQDSPEEAEAVAELFNYFLGQSFSDKNGRPGKIGIDNILVVAPYNLQVNRLKQVLPEGARVGTVDKFQGQEAEIVIVSMATSDEENLPRDIGFLFSRNRLNVAVSRAKILSCLVANPGLTSIRCNTPEDMMLVNTLCKLMAAGSGHIDNSLN